MSAATSGSSCSFSILLKDKFGVPTQMFGRVLVSGSAVEAKASLAVNTPRCIGTKCIFSFMPMSAGNHELWILHEVESSRTHLAGSPVVLNVMAGHVSPSRVQALGSGLTISTAGVPSLFSIIPRDEYSGRVESKALQLQLSLVELGSLSMRSLTDLELRAGAAQSSQDLLQVSYIVTTSGQYLLNVRGLGFHISGSPFSMFCQPDLRNLQVMSNTVLLLATAGISLTFDVKILDRYGNEPSSRLILRSLARLNASGTSARDIAGNAGTIAYSGEHVVKITPTRSGEYALHLRADISSGLSATYYATDRFFPEISSRIDRNLDFSLAAGAKPAVSLTTGSPYSVRWSGFVRPQYAQVYTFFAGVQTAVERMKLWVDNSLLVGQWTSISATENSGTLMIGTANGYYDVVMEYKQPSGTKH
jgi:hypothetical protein